eukprot:CAMPEP_0184070448 /NCGR_PEP_ID=MMETSP0957-20130417/49209_1 /TAXON_ID=627963 /ORGANISM="Aplanochytrium sp, Strain PBS07" /LENGTH=64 /DNA_ID=CAMNT_0026370445 /DNA_START=452 /DNA_END=643 /DNA_ORIENTATION=-
MTMFIPDDEDQIVDDDGIEATPSEEIQSKNVAKDSSWSSIHDSDAIIFLLVVLAFLLLLNVIAW